MNDIETKLEILKELERIFYEKDYLRFGQAIVIALGIDPFYISDKEALEKLKLQ